MSLTISAAKAPAVCSLLETSYEHLRSTLVIIATLNEEPGIGSTISDLRENLDDPTFLVVDGQSRDKTVEIAQNNGAIVVHQDGKGKGDAIAKALEHADLSVDFVALIDADYTYPAEYLPIMIRLLEENPTVGMVCGNRFNGLTDAKTLHSLLYFGNRLLAFAHNILNGVSLHDPLTGLRVIRSEILKNWIIKSKGFDIEVELNHHVERRGYDIWELPIQYRQRLGEKKLKIWHGATILKRIIIETIYRRQKQKKSSDQYLRSTWLEKLKGEHEKS